MHDQTGLGTPINDVLQFLMIFDPPTYHVLGVILDVPFLNCYTFYSTGGTSIWDPGLEAKKVAKKINGETSAGAA